MRSDAAINGKRTRSVRNLRVSTEQLRHRVLSDPRTDTPSEIGLAGNLSTSRLEQLKQHVLTNARSSPGFPRSG